jgi:hypothetical protein
MAKKKPTPPPEPTPPNRKGMPLHVWLEPALIETLQTYVEGVKPRTTKTAVVEQALQQFFTELGLWPVEGEEEK